MPSACQLAGAGATILSGLKSVLETGKPLAVKMGPPARMLAALKELGLRYRDDRRVAKKPSPLVGEGGED
jgi:hypothetical protein